MKQEKLLQRKQKLKQPLHQIKYFKKTLVFIVCWLTIFNIKGQSCLINTNDSLRLSQITFKDNCLKKCKKLDLIKYCLKYKNSRVPNSSIGSYLMEDMSKHSMGVSQGQNTNRFERFSALYFIHHRLINNDKGKKLLIFLKIGNNEIYESYLSKAYSSPEEKQKFINEDIAESEKYDNDISKYFQIVSAYIEDFEKYGEKEAKKRYLDNLLSNKIMWKYSYSN